MAPPLVLYKLERITPVIKSHIPKDTPIEWSLGRSKSGWMKAECFYGYIANVFLPYLKKRSDIKLPVVLFLDGHKSHLSLPLTEFCKENGIILICLFPNATHILQPLDVSFFKPLKAKWKKEAEQHKYGSGSSIEKHEVIPKLDTILRDKSFRSALANGFKACGLFPFNPNSVHYERCTALISANLEEQSSEFLAKLESKLPNEILVQFIVNYRRSCYNGPIEYAELFNIWKAEKSSIEPEIITIKANAIDDDHIERSATESEIDPLNEINSIDEGEMKKTSSPELTLNEKALELIPSESNPLSVKQILESTIVYPSTSKQAKKTSRSQDRRPCVLTSAKWIELEKAVVREREESDKQKEERKAIREKRSLEKKNKTKKN